MIQTIPIPPPQCEWPPCRMMPVFEVQRDGKSCGRYCAEHARTKTESLRYTEALESGASTEGMPRWVATGSGMVLAPIRIQCTPVAIGDILRDAWAERMRIAPGISVEW